MLTTAVDAKGPYAIASLYATFGKIEIFETFDMFLLPRRTRFCLIYSRLNDRVRLFDTRNTRVTPTRLRQLYHAVCLIGTSTANEMVHFCQVRQCFTLVSRVLNKRKRPISSPATAILFFIASRWSFETVVTQGVHKRTCSRRCWRVNTLAAAMWIVLEPTNLIHRRNPSLPTVLVSKFAVVLSNGG